MYPRVAPSPIKNPSQKKLIITDTIFGPKIPHDIGSLGPEGRPKAF